MNNNLIYPSVLETYGYFLLEVPRLNWIRKKWNNKWFIPKLKNMLNGSYGVWGISNGASYKDLVNNILNEYRKAV